MSSFICPLHTSRVHLYQHLSVHYASGSTTENNCPLLEWIYNRKLALVFAKSTLLEIVDVVCCQGLHVGLEGRVHIHPVHILVHVKDSLVAELLAPAKQKETIPLPQEALDAVVLRLDKYNSICS